MFEKNVPLYIEENEDQQANNHCLDLKLKGVSAFPKILFDRREILLPPVPLNVESKCTFRIFNDGYDNMNIKYRVMEELGQINLICRFNEGRGLGVTKNKLRVEAVFSSKKALSFTTKLEFMDDAGFSYIIPVSGSAENCIFTNFPYMMRNKGEYKIQLNEDGTGPISLLDEDNQEDFSEAGSVHKRKFAGSIASGRTFNSKHS